MENLIFVAALPVFIASLVVFLIHPRLVKIAKKKQIVDNPNARKLNKVPVPVLGGVGVFFGLMFGLGVAGYYVQNMEIQFELIIAMMVMLYTGVGDDIMDISPTTRFALQIFTVCLMMFLCGIYIDNFHGLWNIYRLPLGIAIVLTLISGVGIINSINLIDGVDGLCSGYGMFASLLFGICFVRMGDTSYAVLAFSMFGALIPFMMHNMFGAKYKMFLGDGGSLVLGFICSLYVMRIIQSGSEHITGSSVSFTLAVLAVPVFDTLRVMTARMLKGRSPFSADKTHLHVVWHVCNVFDLCPETQLYVTAAAGLILTSGLYYTMDYVETRCPSKYAAMRRFVERHSLHRSGVLLKVRNVLDSI